MGLKELFHKAEKKQAKIKDKKVISCLGLSNFIVIVYVQLSEFRILDQNLDKL